MSATTYHESHLINREATPQTKVMGAFGITINTMIVKQIKVKKSKKYRLTPILN